MLPKHVRSAVIRVLIPEKFGKAGQDVVDLLSRVNPKRIVPPMGIQKGIFYKRLTSSVWGRATRSGRCVAMQRQGGAAHSTIPTGPPMRLECVCGFIETKIFCKLEFKMWCQLGRERPNTR